MFLILTGGANACGDVAGPGRLPDVSEYISGLAEEALDGTGRFVFVDSVRTDGYERIDFARARELALSFVHTFWTYDFSLGGSEGDGLQSLLERQRGAPIDPALLRPEARVAWAQSAYVIPDSIPHFVQKRSGPYAIVRLLERGIPVITVAVSALNTEYEIDAEGGLIMASEHGRDGEGFHVAGVSVGVLYEDPGSPEEAVEAVYRATGMRTVEPPVLLFPPIGFGLSFAKWRLKLEAPVTVNVAGAEGQTTDVLYSGWWPGGSSTTLFVASAEQPVHWSQTWNDPVTGESIELVVPVRGDSPVEFDMVAGVR